MTTTISRRRFIRSSIQAGVATTALYGLTACADDNEPASPASGGSVASWWDNSNLMNEVHKELFKENADFLGGTVKTVLYGNAEMGEALQLAKQSEQLPDVHTTSGLEFPLAFLVENGWFQPLEFTGDAAKNLDKLELLEGIHTFDGKVYSFPQFSGRGSAAMLWFLTDLVEKAGLDPTDPPKTYDDFRTAIRTCQDELGIPGAAIGMNEIGRLGPQIDSMAQTAGFAGTSGIDFATGEYAYDADEYVNALEFLRSLQVDKLLMAGSPQLSGIEARQRWAGGAAVFQMDGPWVPGNITLDFPQLEDKVGFGLVLAPESGMEPATYSPPQGGMHYISATSKEPELANKAFGLLTSDDYQQRLAATGTQPIRDIEAVQNSDAAQLYKDMCAQLETTGFRAPSPIVKNPDVAKVLVEMKQIKPGLSELTQAYVNGDIPDARAALKKLTDDSSKERERAIAAVMKAGAEVSVDDYVFSNWEPRQDYTKDMYA